MSEVPLQSFIALSSLSLSYSIVCGDHRMSASQPGSCKKRTVRRYINLKRTRTTLHGQCPRGNEGSVHSPDAQDLPPRAFESSPVLNLVPYRI